jgi:hypothetical protein
MKQPANNSSSKLKKQPKTNPSKMATQLLLFYQTNFSTAIKRPARALFHTQKAQAKYTQNI